MTERTRTSPGPRLAASTAEVLRMIKIEHSLFALPFALLGMLLAARGLPSAWTVVWILVCMVSARSAAMTFNRILDLPYDARNPRTRARSLPAGRLGLGFAWIFTGLSCAVFVLGAGMLNRTCLLLSPVALAVILGYSATKRFTSLTHFVLGLALAIAPAGAWIAVRGDLTTEPLVLSLAVALWVAGFDILYACQDVAFDRSAGLRSLAVRLGVRRALVVAACLHGAMIATLALLATVSPLGGLFLVGIVVAAGVLVYAHAIVGVEDLSRLKTAFFTANAVVGMVLLVMTLLDLVLRGMPTNI